MTTDAILTSTVDASPAESAGELITALRAACGGAVTAPGDPAYDTARQAWNLAVDQRPAAVVEASDEADVAAVLAVAHRHGCRVAPQSSGHAAAALAGLADAILLRTTGLRGVEIDPVRRSASVRAGTQWAEVLAAAAPHGLAPLAGSAGDVGVVGYHLGGGISYLGRRFGLAVNHVTALHVVLPDGRRVCADAHHHADLFWALRGGGGGVGVVVGLELALHPVPELTAGQMFWPIERAEEVLRAWRDWTETAPEEITTSARLMRFPPDPAVPEPLRGGAFVIVDGAFCGSSAACADVLAPLAALAPMMSTWAPAGVEALSLLHLDPPTPVPAFVEHVLVAEADDATLEALIAAAGADSGTPVAIVELRQLGGALARPAQDGGALSAVEAGFSLAAIAIPGGPAGPEALHAGLERVLAAVAPQAAGTLSSWVDHPSAPSSHAADVAGRLAAIRGQVDPSGVLRSAGDPA